ncbi:MULTISPECIES: AMP-binding protein [unclassified Variovorax]|uniref:AMP-binding protein n=1 Tax=unclassified Variovorax TaxID=663243 RepID=UPI0008CF56EB|nr:MULTISPECIES: AMP-binding protein [unclassified Variovorax]SEK17242.1 fatty-acyl-CoA synthase [Variovorax sp. OK202]SFE75945.1 fatty-acyl-CoA synthase [Variovorax sp. OK212]
MSAASYSVGLERCAANHVPLTPLGFLDRAALVHPRRAAVVHGDLTRTWAQTRERCYRLASALVAKGIQPGDTVSVLAPNTPAMLEAHFGVPLAGAVLNAINHRLDAEGVAFILRHGECKLLMVDREYAGVAAAALALLEHGPLVVDINDHLAPAGEPIGKLDYETLLAGGDPGFAGIWPSDEWQPIALNYTSGTTGDPKGVVASHRGTYLMSQLQITNWAMPRAPRYLWTLPMFHANGWCFTWAISAAAGTHVCLRKVSADAVMAAIDQQGIDHLCAAPTVMAMLADGARARTLPRPVRVLTAGSPPPLAVLDAVRAMGFEVEHVFGITEVSGTPVSCEWQDEWDELPAAEQGKLRVRQGARAAMFEGLMVGDADTLEPVALDGRTAGELMLRGNTVMMGYFKNEASTRRALADGWFRTGDVAVLHDNGYVQITDRSKDVIISGGENISSVEVEDVIHGHPAVLHAAVVAQPDAKWGEVPCVFVELRAGVEQPSEKEIIDFCRARLAHFKCPRRVIFHTLPKTATGKIQKFRLREQAGSASAITHLAGRG